MVLAGILLAIALIYTYFLTPQMSSMGLTLDQFNLEQVTASSMKTMHLVYWSLEITKLTVGTVLLRSFYRNSCTLG